MHRTLAKEVIVLEPEDTHFKSAVRDSLAPTHPQADLPTKDVVEWREGPGTLVVGPHKQLLFINAAARKIIEEWNERTLLATTQIPPRTNDVLPEAIFSLCRDLFQHAWKTLAARDEECFELFRLLRCGNDSLLIRAFTVTRYDEQPAGRVVVTIHRIHSRKDTQQE